MKRTLPLAAAGLVLVGCQHAPQQSHTVPEPPTTQVTHLADSKADGDRVDLPPPAPADTAARVAASTLVASMSDDQRVNALLATDHDARADWHYVPRRRRGLAIGDMTDAQRHDLNDLLQAGLSDAGYLKAMDIVWLESVLQELENRSDDYRDPGKYALLIFGDPADPDAAWGWRFEGHHLSLNFTYAPGAAGGIVTTPMFMGTNPAVVPAGLHAGKRILADEYHRAFEFIATLTDEQREAMMLANAPRDIITGPGRERAIREPAGIAWGDLAPDAQQKLLELIEAYAGRFQRDHRAAIDIPALHFAWAGSTHPEEPHYYRIYCQDRFVIEYITQDGGVGHVHTVLHDLTDPLAQDLLRSHYEQHHAGQ
ncbi:MAG: DUF3500 domain-containing protein [Phycisphaerales bacterium JB063]